MDLERIAESAVLSSKVFATFCGRLLWPGRHGRSGISDTLGKASVPDETATRLRLLAVQSDFSVF